MSDLIEQRAVDLVDALRQGRVTPHDLLDALEARIDRVEPAVNALPTLCFERARLHADRLLTRPVDERGLLCGLPVPIKDLEQVEGVRTTFGSTIYADHISRHSDIPVEHLEAEGAVVYAKSNTPEFGSGANTFNEVFGATRNPWDTRMSAAGSSGGAAAALASGTAWLAQGLDNAGSLRSPASFCGIVGLRPSPGRVALDPSENPYQTHAVLGPMARNVEDVALLLDAMSGWHPADPLSLPNPERSFLESARKRTRPVRIAFSPDLGITPIEPEIAAICKKAALGFEDMGVPVEESHPDFSGVHEAYQVLRAFDYAVGLGDLLETHRNVLRSEIIGNIERGLGLAVGDVIRATRDRAKIRNRVIRFFDDFDFLLCPTTIVPPFPVEQRYVEKCNGVTFDTYIDWLAIVYAITFVSLPALSLPCGFTASGLPVGLQMIGRPRDEAGLLGAALLLEEALGLDLAPILPREKGVA